MNQHKTIRMSSKSKKLQKQNTKKQKRLVSFKLLFGFKYLELTASKPNMSHLSLMTNVTITKVRLNHKSWTTPACAIVVMHWPLVPFVKAKVSNYHQVPVIGYVDLGVVQTPYFSCAEPNWISSTLERHWRNIWFRWHSAKLSSTNVWRTLSNLMLLPHHTKTALPNWFRCHFSAILNSSVRFST